MGDRSSAEIKARDREAGPGAEVAAAKFSEQGRLPGAVRTADEEQLGAGFADALEGCVERGEGGLSAVEAIDPLEGEGWITGADLEVDVVSGGGGLLDLDEVVEESETAAVAVCGRLGEEAEDRPRERGRQLRDQLSRRGRDPGEVGVDELGGIVADEGRAAGEELVERGAQGVEIAAVIDRPIDPAGLLRREVGEAEAEPAGAAGRRSEGAAVGHAEPAELDREGGVGLDRPRVDVAVGDPAGV